MIVNDGRVLLFLQEHLGVSLSPPFTVMGNEKDGMIIGAALFNQFEGANVHVSVAGKGWDRPFLRAVGQYVYGQLSCLRMTFTTEQPDVVEYALRLGGKIEGVMRSHYGERRDGFIIGVLRSEYKYFNKA